MCIPVADSCWYMAKPILYCKVKKLKKKKKKKPLIGSLDCIGSNKDVKFEQKILSSGG